MNIIEEFFLRFNTDAKQARADITDLDKKIVELATKGNKPHRGRGSQGTRRELRALRADRICKTSRILSHQTEGLAGSFTKISHGAGASALLALTSSGRRSTPFKGP